jgi:hypothetical protein
MNKKQEKFLRETRRVLKYATSEVNARKIMNGVYDGYLDDFGVNAEMEDWHKLTNDKIKMLTSLIKSNLTLALVKESAKASKG